MKKMPLLTKLFISIFLGIIIGIMSQLINNNFIMRLLMTIQPFLKNFINFSIPIILLGFITAGIAELGKGAGKLLLITAILAYTSTILAGIFAFIGGNIFLPLLVSSNLELIDIGTTSIAPFFPAIQIEPIMGAVTALAISFLFGLVAAFLDNNSALKGLIFDIRIVAKKLINNVIIPILPLYILTVFAQLSFSGEAISIIKIFLKVYLLILLFHWLIIFIHHSISGSISKQNPFVLIKNMIPAYFTAVGTQSSATTIPVTLLSAKKNIKNDDITDFVIPLCANIHLPGSMTTITICAMAVSYIFKGQTFSFIEYLPFLFTLAIAMVAAPGVPGGAIMVAAGFLVSMLNFDTTMQSIIISLYLAQDSFGTATNVSNDDSIAILVDNIYTKKE